ncbi:pilus assembly protein TadG-related protein [Asticcacaulis solisilvae]
MLFRKYASDKRGNTAMVFALSLVALLSAVAGAVDFSQLLWQKRQAQDALDEAALAVAISSTNDTDTQKTIALTVFKQNVDAKKVNATITAMNFNSTARTFAMTASGTYQPYLLQLVGITSMPYTVNSSTIKAADGTLEVALVLDNTWSMSEALDGSQTKIQVLKTAAASLVSSVMTTANKSYVKMAIVPYANYVNVGTANRSQSWMSVPADYSTTSTKTCTTISTQTTCSGGTKGTCTGTQDGVPYTYSCWIVAQTCTTVNITPYTSCTTPTTTNYKWYGCVYNQMSSGKLVMPDPTTAYVGFLGTSQACLNPIVPLTNDSSVITTGINGLVVNIGSYKPETYIPSGLIWGVNVLSPPAPFQEGAAYDSKNKQPRKAIVLMTDGANTQYSTSSGSVSTANATQLATTYSDQKRVCDYAKSKNIEIYAIGFGVTDATSLANLKYCATDTAHYFDAQSSADLIAAFKTIGGQLTKVRITG